MLLFSQDNEWHCDLRDVIVNQTDSINAIQIIMEQEEMRMCVIVEDFITVEWCKWDCDFGIVLLWYQDTHTEIYMRLNISER